MAQKNRLAPSVATYLILGMLTGVAIGFATNMLMAALSKARFEASLVLYRIPAAGTRQAARDFISVALNELEFIEKFAVAENVDPKLRDSLDHHLTVFAQDPSSPNAEIRLVGKDPNGLVETLDSLGKYLSENLRTTKETELQSLLIALNQQIELANAEYLNLLDKRAEHTALDGTLGDVLQSIVQTSARLFELELTELFSLTPGASKSAQSDSLLRQVVEKLDSEKNRGIKLAKQNREDFEFATSLALAETKLRALRRTKQRLIIQFNQSTPLRVAGRAKIGLLDAKPPPTALIFGVSTLLGTLIGGIICSLIHTRNTKLTGPTLERRLGTSVMATIPQSVTDFGVTEGCPMAVAQPQRVSVAAIHSFNTSLNYFVEQSKKATIVVFSELGNNFHAPHLIANYAVILAEAGKHALVVESATGQLASLFNADLLSPYQRTFSIHYGIGGLDAALPDSEGSITVTHDGPEETAALLSEKDFLTYDYVLVLAESSSQAKHLVQSYPSSIGLLVCSYNDRISKLRKTIGNTLHGLVICGYPLEESIYGGEAPSVRQRLDC